MRQFGFLLGASEGSPCCHCLPKDAEAGCLELAKFLATVHTQALAHDKGGKSMIKTFKAVLDQ